MTEAKAAADDVHAKRASPLGARASNAGDQYQELWALQQALGLLDPSTKLTAVTVEGVLSDTPEEEQRSWDGVDCALYFGGQSVETADKIVFAQHKYSTTSPETAWTVARLVSSKKKSGDNSVIRRLADSFRAAKQQMKVGSELEIRLVSNQGIASEVFDVINTLAGASTIGENDKLADNMRKVRAAANLNEADLALFATSLDLSESGTSSRYSLRRSITKHVAEMLGEDEGASVRELMFFIRELMMPGKEREYISRQTILGWFGVAAESGLFPAPSDFKTVANPIEREPARALLTTLQDGSPVTCLHGSAGCGKTTTLMQLRALLPPSSVLALFDCYGGGRYLFTTDRRHLPEHAFTQIANELSLGLGIPFLLARASNTPILVSRFLDRIKLAAELLSKSDTNAFLVVGIDAADNSVTAAQKQNPAEACFVTELAQADLSMLPSNVRLVFSARTARKESLRLPPNTNYIECPAFSSAETGAFARRFLPTANDEWVNQFHALSNGVPRVQDYAIRAGNSDPHATLNALRPGGKNLNDVLRKLFGEAAQKSGTSYDFLMSCLAALPSPVPLRHLSGVSQLQESEIVDFVQDTGPSLRLEEEGISIADEDVEDFIRQEGSHKLAQALQQACDYFKPIYASDPYAAVNYADLLVDAGRQEQILPMLEQNLSPAAIADPIVRREIQLRRLRLAHAACRAAGDSMATMKVVLLGAEAAKDQAFLAEILDKHPDLSTRFARPSLVRLVLSDADRAKKQGRILVQDAARAARNGNPIQAREQLHYYDEWIVRRNKAPRDERGGWSIEIDDIVTYSECVSVLEGAAAAYDDLKRWKSKSLRLSVGLKLAPRLIAHGNGDILERAIREKVLPTAWEILLLIPLALSGAQIEVAQLERSLKAFNRAFKHTFNIERPEDRDDDWKVSIRSLLITAVEVGFSRGMSEVTVRQTLSLAAKLDAPIERSYNEPESALDITIRAWLLRQLLGRISATSEDFLNTIDPPPPKPTVVDFAESAKRRKKKATKQEPQKRRKFDDEQRRIISAVFPAYVSRASILNSYRKNETAATDLADNIPGLGSDEYLFKRYSGLSIRRLLAHSVLDLMHLEGLSWERLFAKASSFAALGYDDPFGNHLLPLWRALLLRSETRDFVLNSLVQRTPLIRAAKEPASSKVDAAIEFSRLALTFSEPDARVFYEEAISVAQDIDREAINQIGVLERLTTHFALWDADAKTSVVAQLLNTLTDIAVRLRDQDHFPWEECVNSLVRLHPPTALAAVSRWSDQGIEDHPKSLRLFLSEALRINEISPAVTAALLILDPYVPNQLRLDLVNRLKDSDEALTRDVVNLLAEDILLDEGPLLIGTEASALLKAASSLSVKDPREGYQRLVQTLQYLADNKLIERPIKEEEKEATPKLNKQTFLTREDIEAEYASVRQPGKYFNPGPFLAQMADTVTSPGDRVAFLDALSASDLGSYAERARVEAILAALAKWDSPSVNHWRSQRLPSVIVQHFLGLTQLYDWRYRHLEDILAATRLADRAKLDILAEGLEATSLSLGSRSLFVICEQMACFLAPEEAWSIFGWYLQRVSNRVALDDTALATKDIPVDQEESLGRFLFALMSDFDTRIRWRAAHAMRRLARLGQSTIFGAVFAQYGRTSDAAFRDPASPFYWLSAQLWSVIAAARISHESPESLRSIHAKLIAIATSAAFPHILIREYAKDALLTLHGSGEIVLGAQILRTIAAINTSPHPSDKRKENPAGGLRWADGQGRRVDFGMDTVEHVLNSILRMFVGLSKHELFQRLEHWLVDELKTPQKVHYWDSEPRKARYNERQWGLYHSSKGSMPVLERHGFYLEWNAILCVVGELLAKYPLWEPDNDRWDMFRYWLSSKLLTVAPVWLADLRDPKPLEDQFWLEGNPDEKRWVSRTSQKDFLAALFTENGSNKSVVTVDGTWTSAFPTREVKATVTSALINPATAAAFARSLSMRDRRQWPYYLPDEDKDELGGFHDMPYKLVGWLVEMRNNEGLDIKDTLRNGTKGPTKSPGTSAVADLQLQPASLPAKSWISQNSKKTVIREIVWADLPERYDNDGGSYRQRETKSEGSVLRIDADVLMSFLQKQQMSLIVGIHFERRLENEYGGRYDDKTKKVKAFERFFVLRTDGTIEDYNGAFGTWCKAR